jgi:hypothetical protein
MDFKKIALVKQDVYQDLYCIKPFQPAISVLKSSLRRAGPVGLLKECDADFFIVKTSFEKECSVWQEKHYDCFQREIKYYEDIAKKVHTELPHTKGRTQASLALNLNEIDWTKYDIIVSIDICFPSKFVKKYPKVLWCYMPGEPCMGVYKRSSRGNIIEGYHVFLNQELRYKFTYRNVYFPCNKTVQLPFPTFTWRPKYPIELDFPYSFSSAKSIESLYDKVKKDQIALEFYTKEELCLSAIERMERNIGINWYCNSRDIAIRLSNLVKVKYFLTHTNHYLRGNALIEAASSGCLCLSTRGQFTPNYQRLLGERGNFRSINEIISFMEKLQLDNDLYLKHKRAQDELINKYCFLDPLKRLYDVHKLLIEKNLLTER